MRPIVAHMCLYESAKNGTLDLHDFAIMNDALTIESENSWRMREALKDNANG